MIAVVAYLAAIAAANLIIAAYGPAAAIPVAFVLIGFDFTCRDYLQQRLEVRGPSVWLWMAGLVAAGGLISYLVNAGAAEIAVASSVSFMVASTMDAFVFAAFGRRVHRFYRWNGTNLVGAAIDSVLFLGLAFGPAAIFPLAIAQYAAKVAGGVVWSLVLVRAVPVRRQAA